MNLVGKIFAFLVLAMSLVFMAFAVAVYGTHKNWRDVVENPNTGLKAKIVAEQAKIKEQEEQIDVLKKQIVEGDAEKRTVLAKLESYRTTKDTELANIQAQQLELQQTNQATVAAMTAGQSNLDKMTKEVEVLRKEIREAQAERDKSFDQVVKLTDQVHQVTNEITRLKEREGQLAQQLAATRMILSKRGISAAETDVPPPLRGKVLAVSTSDLLELSLGADDGIRAGNTLEVFRGNSYLGRVQVVKTESNRAVAKILPDFKKGAIQKGDDVATQLKVG